MPKQSKQQAAEISSENWIFVVITIVLGILVLSAIAAFKAPVQMSGIELTSLTHKQTSIGTTEFTISIMNTNNDAVYCHAILNITKGGVLYKSIRENAGVIQPNQEKAMQITAVVPKGAEFSTGTYCTET